MHGGDIYRNQVTLDFSVNINPLGMPESVRQALRDAVEDCTCYPDERQEALRAAIGAWEGVPADWILCGNGASELFPAIVRGLRPKRILIPVPSFFGYEKAAKAWDADLRFYEMKAEKGFRLDEGILPLLTKDLSLVFLANPNNPVGDRIAPDLLEQVLVRCREQGIAVILDECFLGLTEGGRARSYFPRLEEFPRLFVVSAFTKLFAIPGVRLGYLGCGDPQLRDIVEAQLPEWNLSVFAQRAGVAAVGERGYCRRSRSLIAQERAYLAEGLGRLGIQVYPSETNYLLFYTEVPLAKELLERGILIRDCENFRGLKKGYYRAAIRQRAEQDRLLAEIGAIICR